MKSLVALLVILLAGTAFANEFCSAQKPLGFEKAVFMLGADVLNGNSQEAIDQLSPYLNGDLKQIDAFVTPKTTYQLFRDVVTNELVLLTSSAKHVCFYRVPTEEPILSRYKLS